MDASLIANKAIICHDQKVMMLQSSKMGQILCVKKVPFCKSGHILFLYQFGAIFLTDIGYACEHFW